MNDQERARRAEEIARELGAEPSPEDYARRAVDEVFAAFEEEAARRAQEVLDSEGEDAEFEERCSTEFVAHPALDAQVRSIFTAADAWDEECPRERAREAISTLCIMAGVGFDAVRGRPIEPLDFAGLRAEVASVDREDPSARRSIGAYWWAQIVLRRVDEGCARRGCRHQGGPLTSLGEPSD